VTPRDAWPIGPLLAVTAGVAILALPASVEGPPLVPISPGHALSALDAIGVAPLALGSLWLHTGLWRRRSRLSGMARARPGLTFFLTFAAGLGLGLLLASAFSLFHAWWAIGAALFGAANLALVLALRAEPR
jgi:hypothetical protein